MNHTMTLTSKLRNAYPEVKRCFCLATPKAVSFPKKQLEVHDLIYPDSKILLKYVNVSTGSIQLKLPSPKQDR